MARPYPWEVFRGAPEPVQAEEAVVEVVVDEPVEEVVVDEEVDEVTALLGDEDFVFIEDDED